MRRSGVGHHNNGIMQRFVVFVITFSVAGLHAAAPAIGVVTSSGSFQMNHERVSGNGTVFEGAAIQTEEDTSRVRLKGGAWVELAAESRATIFADHVRLEAGFGELQAGSGFQVEALGLRIRTGAPRALARIRLDGGNTVLVGAVHGPVRVYSQSGLLVANVAAGAAFSFQPDAAAPDEFRIAGCLLTKDKHYIVVAATGNQTVEVQGENVAAEAGNRVEVTGKALPGIKPVAGASLVIQVKTLQETGRGGCVAAATAVNASTKPAEATKSHTGAIIAGVAVAAAGGGVAAAVCCKGSKPSTSP